MGLAGAKLAGPPVLVSDGARRLAVHPLEPTGEAPLEVTVASGASVHLAGVLGSRLAAPALADALRQRSLGELLGTLVPTPQGSAQVRWLVAEDAP